MLPSLNCGEKEGFVQKKGHKKRVSYFHRTAQPLTLAPFPAWGIQQELVVKDLPAAKLTIIFIIDKKISTLLKYCGYICQVLWIYL